MIIQQFYDKHGLFTTTQQRELKLSSEVRHIVQTYKENKEKKVVRHLEIF